MNSNEPHEPITIIQVTDTHLYSVPRGTLLNMNTRESLSLVLDLIQRKEEKMDLILATGDITQDGSDEAYKSFMYMIRQLETPYRWIPGNHDNAIAMERISSGSPACQRTEILGNWQICLLDSSVDEQVHGFLQNSQLELLQRNLSAAEADPTIEHSLVTLHHNPIPGRADWMKDIGLQNSEAFWSIVAKFDKVRAVVYGHIHQELDFIHNGVRCLCTPSTCIQFKPVTEEFALDDINPGYRCLQLFADGNIETRVERVTDHKFDIDFHSIGY